MSVQEKSTIASDKRALYEKLVAANPEVERKMATHALFRLALYSHIVLCYP